jgi:fructose-1,6-bisphosphatase/inositol monophosphatase family enzyme
MNEQEVKEEFLKVIPEIIKEAGKLALELREDLKVYQKSNTGRASADTVTNADFEVQEYILKEILKTKLKDCKMFAEEDTETAKKFPENSKFLISTDPIDGTLKYARKKEGYWQTIIQLKTRYKFLITMIYFPMTDQLLVVDQDIKLNGKKLEETKEKEKYILISSGRPPSKKAEEYVNKKKLEFKITSEPKESKFISYSKKKYSGKHTLKMNKEDSFSWAHITEVLGGKTEEIHSGKIIGENFDFYTFEKDGYYKGECISLIEE